MSTDWPEQRPEALRPQRRRGQRHEAPHAHCMLCSRLSCGTRQAEGHRRQAAGTGRRRRSRRERLTQGVRPGCRCWDGRLTDRHGRHPDRRRRGRLPPLQQQQLPLLAAQALLIRLCIRDRGLSQELGLRKRQGAGVSLKLQCTVDGHLLLLPQRELLVRLLLLVLVLLRRPAEAMCLRLILRERQRLSAEGGLGTGAGDRREAIWPLRLPEPRLEQCLPTMGASVSGQPEPS